MKKLLVVILALFSFALVGCGNESALQNETAIAELQDDIDALEIKVEQLQNQLDNLQYIEGMNGQREYYIPTALSLELLGEELDKSKAPSYVLDENEDYIPFDDVAEKLMNKYFEDKVTLYDAKVGMQVLIYLLPIEGEDGIEEDEFMARAILMIEELSNYDFYIIGSSQLQIQTVFSGTSWIIIPIQTLRSSFVTITPEVIYQSLYEVDVYHITYDQVAVQNYYDAFVASGEYDGYVLNY